MTDSETFQLSIPAQNVEAKFYNKRGIVYVEGPDDPIFWAQYFPLEQFEIRPLNGCKKIEGIEDDIINHGLKCIVAKDADYSRYTSTQPHPLIVCTLSHSIECVMYCPNNINAYLKKLARCLDDHVPEITSAYDQFCEDVKDLVAYDIANNIYGLGCPVCDNSCITVMQSNSSINVSKEKVEDLIKSLAKSIPAEKVEDAKRLMNKDRRSIRQIMKGHFQTGFVLNLLKHFVDKLRDGHNLAISKDAMFAGLVTCSPDCHVNCIERQFIMQEVKAALKSL